MDIRVAISNELLAQAERCFAEKQLTHEYLEFVAKNTPNKQEMLRKLQALNRQITTLENNAKTAFEELKNMEREVISDSWDNYKRADPFSPDEINDFFENNSSEFLDYLQSIAPLSRVESSIRQLESLRVKSAKLIEVAKKDYNITNIKKISRRIETKKELKKLNSDSLQLDRGIIKDNLGRF